jgi:hypothetical protein
MARGTNRIIEKRLSSRLGLDDEIAVTSHPQLAKSCTAKWPQNGSERE